MKRVALALTVLVLIPDLGAAANQHCTWPNWDYNFSGDSYYRDNLYRCRFDLRDFYRKQHGMKKKEWDNGFGWEEPCRTRLPFANEMHAILALNYSPLNYATKTNDFSGTIYRWAGNYVIKHFGGFDAMCYKEDNRSTGMSLGGSGVIAYWPHFYGVHNVGLKYVPLRASGLLHEARHRDGWGHNGANDQQDCCAKPSCDTDWDYRGANVFQTLWLWRYSYEGGRATPALREAMWEQADKMLRRYFGTCAQGGIAKRINKGSRPP